MHVRDSYPESLEFSGLCDDECHLPLKMRSYLLDSSFSSSLYLLNLS